MQAKIHDGGNHQDDEPDRPGMKLVPMGMMIPGKHSENDQIDGSHTNLLVNRTGLLSHQCMEHAASLSRREGPSVEGTDGTMEG